MLSQRCYLRPELQHDRYSLWWKKSLQRERPGGVLVHPLQNDLGRKNNPAGDITYRVVQYSRGQWGKGLIRSRSGELSRSCPSDKREAG